MRKWKLGRTRGLCYCSNISQNKIVITDQNLIKLHQEIKFEVYFIMIDEFLKYFEYYDVNPRWVHDVKIKIISKRCQFLGKAPADVTGFPTALGFLRTQHRTWRWHTRQKKQVHQILYCNELFIFFGQKHSINASL